MSRESGFAAVRVFFALAVCALAAGLVWSGDRKGSPGGVGLVTGPADLAAELRRVQLLSAPAAGDRQTVDAGAFEFVPGLAPEDADLGDGLVPETGDDGSLFMRVTLYEDAASRETVFLNANGDEAARIPPPAGYDPGWIAETLYPGGVPSAEAAAACDPSRTLMTARLFPSLSVGVSSPAAVSVARQGVSSPAVSGAGALAGSGAVQDGQVSAASAAASGAAVTNALSDGATDSAGGSDATVYVDRDRGRDGWTGRRAVATASDGPKRTVKAGLSEALAGGGRLAVLGGTYSEGLDVRGKNVSVRFEGNVVLSSSARDVVSSGSESGAASADGSAPTGTVFSASN